MNENEMKETKFEYKLLCWYKHVIKCIIQNNIKKMKG